MSLAKVLEHFDLVAEAPDGIARLRELVLQLAVRGKLVPQDPRDEPASELLKRIGNDRAASINFSKGRNGKTKSPTPTVDVPFDVPDGWVWTKLEFLGQSTADVLSDGPFGSKLKSEHYVSTPGYRVLRLGNVGRGQFKNRDQSFISPEHYKSLIRYELKALDILVASLGDPPGRACLVPEYALPAINKADCFRIRVANQIYSPYVCAVLNSPLWIQRSLELHRGDTRGRINLSHLKSVQIPLPPYAEQRRIIRRANQLTSHLDRLELRQKEREAARVAARDSALAEFCEAATFHEIATAWARLQARMGDLLKAPEDLSTLREAIQSLAVRGKLVPQDPRNEPPARTLGQGDRSRSVDTKSTDSLDEDVPFQVPQNWAWVKFNTVFTIRSGLTKGRVHSAKATMELPYLRVANVKGGYLDLTQIKTIEVPVDEVDRYLLRPGDLLLTEGGDWDKLGRSAVWGGEIQPCLHQNHVFCARPIDPRQNSTWFSRYSNSLQGRLYFQACSKQTTNLASINKTQLSNWPVPVPPFLEQNRIVARVDEMMALCDHLESRLAAARDAQAALAAALLHEVERDDSAA